MVAWGAIAGVAASALGSALSNKGGGSSSDPYKVEKYTPEQMELLNKLVGRANEGLTSPVPESPDMYVPETGLESNYLDWARSKAAGFARGETPYAVGDEYVDQYMSAYRPIWQRARNEALDLARGEYAGPTYWGTARANRLSELGSEWGEKYAMTEADLRLKQDQVRRDAIDKYIGVGTEGIRTGANLERGVAEQRVLNNLNKFLRGEQVQEGGKTYQDPIYNQNVGLSLALLGLSPYAIGSSSETEGDDFLSKFGGGLFSGVGSMLSKK